MTTQFTSSIFGLLKRGREAVARGQLSGTGFALLFVLTEYANEKNDTEVWPCQKTLRDRIGLDGKHAVRSVRRLLDRLEALNLIEVDSGQGKHRVSTYRLILRQANPASPCPPDKRTPESAYCDDKWTLETPKADSGSTISGLQSPTELLREPLTEPKGRETRPSPMPDDWPTSSDKQAAIALWMANGRPDLIPKIDEEARAARRWHLRRATRSGDWCEKWVSWADRTIGYSKPPGLPATADSWTIVKARAEQVLGRGRDAAHHFHCLRLLHEGEPSRAMTVLDIAAKAESHALHSVVRYLQKAEDLHGRLIGVTIGGVSP